MKKIVGLLMIFMFCSAFSAEYIDGVTQRNEVSKIGIAGGQTIIGGTSSSQRLNLRGNSVNLTSGGITILDTTVATNSTSGALIVSGGVGVSGDVIIASGKGLKNGTVQVVGARQTGFTAMTGTATKTAIDTDTALLQDVARRLKAIDDALRAHGLID